MDRLGADQERITCWGERLSELFTMLHLAIGVRRRRVQLSFEMADVYFDLRCLNCLF